MVSGLALSAVRNQRGFRSTVAFLLRLRPMFVAPFKGDPFDALGDSNRRAIVELLTSGGRTVGETADDLPISRPAVSRHFRRLKEAGLVTAERRGPRPSNRFHARAVQ